MEIMSYDSLSSYKEQAISKSGRFEAGVLT